MMHHVPQTRLTLPAVAGRLERGVRPQQELRHAKFRSSTVHAYLAGATEAELAALGGSLIRMPWSGAFNFLASFRGLPLGGGKLLKKPGFFVF
jgi:hypothetical protein